MALVLNTDKIDSCMNSYREVFSDPLKSGDDYSYNAGVILPLDFSLEMDGISGLIPHSAFTIPANTLPKSYIIQSGSDKGKQKIAFILHSIEQNFNNNKWTTKIAGQTLNIRFEPLTEEEKKAIQDAKNKQESLRNFVNRIPGGGSNTPTTGGYADPKNFLPFLKGDWVERAVLMISKLEGFSKVPSWDYNKYRGGYGTDKYISAPGAKPVEVTPSTRFTEVTAKLTLDYDIRNRFYNNVTKSIGKNVFDKLNDNQKAALISYSYNTGNVIYNNISVNIKNNNYAAAAEGLRKGPITATDKKTGITSILQPLVNRRNLEALIFSTPVN